MKRKKPRTVTAEQIDAITRAMEASLDKKFAVIRFCGTAEPWILSETLSHRSASQLLAHLKAR